MNLTGIHREGSRDGEWSQDALKVHTDHKGQKKLYTMLSRSPLPIGFLRPLLVRTLPAVCLTGAWAPHPSHIFLSLLCRAAGWALGL